MGVPKHETSQSRGGCRACRRTGGDGRRRRSGRSEPLAGAAAGPGSAGRRRRVRRRIRARGARTLRWQPSPAAGGVVVDVQEQIGLALVETAGGRLHRGGRRRRQRHRRRAEPVDRRLRAGRAQVRATERLTVMERGRPAGRRPAPAEPSRRAARTEPLESLQWDMAMIGATADGAHRRATGRRVTVGIIDTGVDASHPDIAPNFSYELSQNFTHDIPAIDGPCDVPTCIDPAWVDEGGHGTHVAGTSAPPATGSASRASLPTPRSSTCGPARTRASSSSTRPSSALLYAGDMGLDVVNMSFFTDPWLFNCDSDDDYVSGDVTEEQIAEQAMIRTGVLAALDVRPRAAGSRWWPQPATSHRTWPLPSASTHQPGLPARHRAGSRRH